ncbi:MAG TPA: hypothetical protein VJW73_18450 [Gemmatimonadaceae bacterium]|nr:hypothetical protein [Gemmatimonadaceae bacterium]
MSAACPLFGFVVQLRIDDVSAVARLLAAMRADLLDGRGLSLIDTETPRTYIITGDGFQATDADREAVVSWLAAQPLGRHCTVGALDDVGHAA